MHVLLAVRHACKAHTKEMTQETKNRGSATLLEYHGGRRVWFLNEDDTDANDNDDDDGSGKQ